MIEAALKEALELVHEEVLARAGDELRGSRAPRTRGRSWPTASPTPSSASALTMTGRALHSRRALGCATTCAMSRRRLDAPNERYELRRRLGSLNNERTRSVGELEDARVRVARDDERDEEEQLERNERKRQVVADSIASRVCTLHAADAESAWQHERLVGWLLFHLSALDVLDTPL